jgi:hypothetical protein
MVRDAARWKDIQFNCFGTRMMDLIILLLLILIIYFLSSGVAFASIYKFPENAPKKLFGWFFAPLDLLASRVVIFQKIYNSYHNWCYRKLANKKVGDN